MVLKRANSGLRKASSLLHAAAAAWAGGVDLRCRYDAECLAEAELLELKEKRPQSLVPFSARLLELFDAASVSGPAPA